MSRRGVINDGQGLVRVCVTDIFPVAVITERSGAGSPLTRPWFETWNCTDTFTDRSEHYRASESLTISRKDRAL